jgi:predicted enzyme related to lactoylglutathione lyase
VPSTVQPVLVTPDLDRLRGFYAGLVGVVETWHVPDEGPIFYQGLRIGDSDVGLVANSAVPTGRAGRMLLSIGVADVDALVPRVEALGGRVTGGPTDMPWGQRVLHVEDPDGNGLNLTQQL